MNAPILTRVAEGLFRRAFVNRDIARMIAAGVIDEDESFELIAGEIVPIAPEYDRHARPRNRIWRDFSRVLGDSWFVASKTSLFLADDIEFKPDLHVFPYAMKSEDVRGPDVALAVELSSTTQRRDLATKAPLYARHGVRELWVIDLETQTGIVFDRIENGAYAPGRSVGADDILTPGAFPEVSVRIADLV